jgi:hypothetical protein
VAFVEVGDEPGVLGLPAELLLGQGAGGGAVEQGEGAIQPKWPSASSRVTAVTGTFRCRAMTAAMLCRASFRGHRQIIGPRGRLGF